MDGEIGDKIEINRADAKSRTRWRAASGHYRRAYLSINNRTRDERTNDSCNKSEVFIGVFVVAAVTAPRRPRRRHRRWGATLFSRELVEFGETAARPAIWQLPNAPFPKYRGVHCYVVDLKSKPRRVRDSDAIADAKSKSDINAASDLLFGTNKPQLSTRYE